MQDSQVFEYVLLWNRGDVVGMARLLFEPGSSRPSRILHGRDLQTHAKSGEVLVIIHNVLIFVEFEHVPYPYWFDGIETPPQTLGELNREYFRGVVVWDLNRTVKNPRPSLGILGEHPRPVSCAVIDSFRDLTRSGSRRVSFGTVSVHIISPVQASTAQPDRVSVPAMDGTTEDGTGLTNEEHTMAGRAGSGAGSASLVLRNDRRSGEDYSSNQSSRWADWQCSSYRLRMKLKAVHEERSKLGKRKREGNGGGSLLGSEECSGCVSERRSGRERPVRRKTSFAGNEITSSESLSPLTDPVEPGCMNSQPGAAVVDSDVFSSGANPIEGLQAEASRAAVRTTRGVAGSRCTNKDQLGLTDMKIKKRKYTFNTRRRASPKKMSAFRRKCLELIEKARRSNPFLEPRDCCSMYCFDNVNPDYAVSQYIKFLDMKRPERKRSLSAMLDKAIEKFRFDGQVVCSKFVSTGLSFSYSLQSSVKGTPLASSSSSVQASPREVRRETMKDRIILFLRRLASTTGDNMPNRTHVNLPSMTKVQVYKKYLEELRAQQSINVPTKSYFCTVWKDFCSVIKTHRHHGFTVCGDCEVFRSQMDLLSGNEEAQAIVRRNQSDHFRQMKEERLGYAERRDLANKYPNKYCSLIVDGADQRSYGLPHFIFDTKADKGHKLKVKIVGVLEHGMLKNLSLFTMTEEFERGANHVIEAVHRVLQEKKTKMGRLPETLLVQADNCTRENKNRYVLSYLEMLVARGVFVEVQISFLPIGHTHADVDQCFSVVARRLRMVDTVTMKDLITELGSCYTPPAKASQISAVANFSGLCNKERCLVNVPTFSYYRYFRFTRHSSSTTAENRDLGSASFRWFKTTCDVKYQHHEEWCPLDNSASRKGFLRHVPDLNNTPNLETRPPTNVQEINDCLRSHEGRINSTEKLEELKTLRDIVYTPRVDAMPWNVDECFETNGDYLNGPIVEAEEAMQQNQNHTTAVQVPYTLNYFLAVRTDEDVPEPFWIARTMQLESTDDQGNVSQLKIRWYQAKSGSNSPYSARYEISTYNEKGEARVFDDTLDVRTILCEFESLNRMGGLHVRTQKAIRQALNQH